MPTHTPVPHGGLVRTVLTRGALARLLLGWAAVGALTLMAPLLAEPLPSPVLALLLAAIIAIIVVAAGGVVQQAEALAHRLGDPYGTLVLTLSIVVIEVVLIAAVMLGPGEHATIARDWVMAVSMIIMNLALGRACWWAGCGTAPSPLTGWGFGHQPVGARLGRSPRGDVCPRACRSRRRP